MIPKGYYCYDENGTCPYWRKDIEHDLYQENGYCEFLQKGDYELNREMVLRDTKTGKQKIAADIGIKASLLWDKVKECGKNYIDEADSRPRKRNL